MHDEDADDVEDLGTPVSELRELAETPKSGFLQGIRNRIERRAFAGNMLDLSISILGEVVLQYLSLIFSFFGSENQTKTREDDSDE